MGETFARDVTEIATALLGVALVALLVSHAGQAGSLIKATSDAYGGLLKVVTLQSPYGNSFSGT